MLRYWRIILLLVMSVLFLVIFLFLNKEVFALFWFFMSRVQMLWVKVLAIATLWLKRLSIKYVLTTGLFEGFKKFMLNVLIPSLLLPSWRRWIRYRLEALKCWLSEKRTHIVQSYKGFRLFARVLIALAAMLIVMVLSLFSWQIGIVILLLKVPGWIVEPLVFLFYRVLHWIQKKIIIIFAFLGLFKFWARFQKLLPESYLRRMRAAEFKVKRRAIKSRRYTLQQFKKSKSGWGLWFAIWRERLRLRREVPKPTEKELLQVEKEEGILKLRHKANTKKEHCDEPDK